MPGMIWIGATYFAKPAVRFRKEKIIREKVAKRSITLDLVRRDEQWLIALPNRNHADSTISRTYPITCYSQRVGQCIYHRGHVRIELEALDAPVLIESEEALATLEISSGADIILSKCSASDSISIQAPNIVVSEIISSQDVYLNATHQIQIQQCMTVRSLLHCHADKISILNDITTEVAKFVAFEDLTQQGILVARNMCSIKSKHFLQQGRVETDGYLKVKSENYHLSQFAKSKAINHLKVNCEKLTNYGSIVSKRHNLMTISYFEHHAKLKISNNSVILTRQFHSHPGSILKGSISADKVIDSVTTFCQLFKSQETFNVDESAQLTLSGAILSAERINIYALECALNNSKVSATYFDIMGKVQVFHGNIEIQTQLSIAPSGALTLKASNLVAALQQQEGAVPSLQVGGTFQAEQSQIHLDGALLATSESNFSLTANHIYVKDGITLGGRGTIQQTKADIGKLNVQNVFSIHDSDIDIETLLCVEKSAQLTVEHTKVQSLDMDLEGVVQFKDGTQVHIDEKLFAERGAQLNAESSMIVAPSMDLSGVIALKNNSYAEAKTDFFIDEKGQLTIDDSVVTGNSAEVDGALTINNSGKLVTTGIAILKGASTLTGQSIVDAQRLAMHGCVQVHDSEIIGRECVGQRETSSLALTKSALKTGRLILRGANTLSGGVMMTHNIDLFGSLSLKQQSRLYAVDFMNPEAKATIVCDSGSMHITQALQLDGQSTFSGSQVFVPCITLTASSSSDFRDTHIGRLHSNGAGEAPVVKPLDTLMSSGNFALSNGSLLATDAEFHAGFKITESQVQTERLSYHGQSRLTQSTLVTTIHEQASDTRFNARGSTIMGSYTTLRGHARLSSDTRWVADTMIQHEGRFSASASSIFIKKTIETKAHTSLRLTADAKLVGVVTPETPKITGILDGDTAIRQSVVQMPKILVNHMALVNSKLIADNLHIKKGRANNSIIQGNNYVTVSEKLDVNNDSTLNTTTFTSLPGSSVTLHHSKLMAKEHCQTFGVLDTRAESEIQAKKLDAYSQLKLTGKSRMAVLTSLVLGTQSQADIDESVIVAEEIDVYNTLQLNKGQRANQKGEYAGEASTIMAKKNLSFHHRSSINANNARLVASQDMRFETQTQVTGNAVVMKSKSLSNAGNINIESLTIDTDYLDNCFARIHGGKRLTIVADKCLGNAFGRISADNLQIKAGLSFNFMGDVVGYDNFDLQTLVNLNLGAHRSCNYNANTLFDLSGIVLPSIPNSADAIFSWQHAKNFSRTALNLMFPGASAGINLAFQAAPLAYSATTKLYDAAKISIQKIRGNKDASYSSLLPQGLETVYQKLTTDVPGENNTFWDRISRVRVTDVMPTMLAVKGLYASASGFYYTGQNFADGFKVPEGGGSCQWQKMCSKKELEFKAPDFTRLFQGALTAFGPSANQNSLIGINLGITASANVTRSDWVSFNSGVMAANTLIHNGHAVSNSGMTMGNNVIMTGASLDNSGLISNWNSMHLTFNTIDVKRLGVVDGHSAQIKADTLNDQGQVTLQQSQLDVNHLCVGSADNHDARFSAYQSQSTMATVGNHGHTRITGLSKEQADAEAATKQVNGATSSSAVPSDAPASEASQPASSAPSDSDQLQESAIDRTKAENYASRLAVTEKLTNHKGGELDISHTHTNAKLTENSGRSQIRDGYLGGDILDLQQGQLDLTRLVTEHELVQVTQESSLTATQIQMRANSLKDEGQVEISQSELELGALLVGSANNHDARFNAYQSQSKITTVDNHGHTRITGLTKEQADAEAEAKQVNGATSPSAVPSEAPASEALQPASSAPSDTTQPDSAQIQESEIDRTKADNYASRLAVTEKLTNHKGGELDISHTHTNAKLTENSGRSQIRDGYLGGDILDLQQGQLDLTRLVTEHELVQVTRESSLTATQIQMRANSLKDEGQVEISQSELELGALQVGSANNHDARFNAYQSQSKITTVDNHGHTRITGLTKEQADAEAEAKQVNGATSPSEALSDAPVNEASQPASSAPPDTTKSDPEQPQGLEINRANPDNYSSHLTTDELINHKGGNLEISYTWVDTEEGMKNHGQAEVSHSYMQGQSLISHGSQASFTAIETTLAQKQIRMSDAIDLENVAVRSNDVRLDHGQARLRQVDMQAVNTATLGKSLEVDAQDVDIQAKKIHQESQITFESYLGLKASEHLSITDRSSIHARHQTQQDVLDLSGPQGSLHGDVSTGKLVCDVAEFRNAEQLIRGVGEYGRWQVAHDLLITTLFAVDLHSPIHRQCGLDITAHSIDFRTDYTINSGTIRLKSTVGKIHLWSSLGANYVYADSATHLYTSRSVIGREQVIFNAAGNYYNLGGDIAGRQVGIKAQGAFNYTRGSAAAAGLSRGYRDQMGSGGSIIGEEVFLEATHTNIENHGGTFIGTRYLQGIAAQDIVVVANEESFKGKHDTEKRFIAAQIVGGTGRDEKQLGLYLQAGNKVFNEGSFIGGAAHGYIEATHGVESRALSHTYISKQEKKRKWYGSKKKKTKTATTVQNATFSFTAGGLEFYIPEGGLYSEGSHFLTRDGVRAFTRDDIELYSLVTMDKKTKEESSLWGLNRSSSKSTSASASPTLIADNGTTILKSKEGNIFARGAAILGNGDFLTSAENGKVNFSQDILRHSMSMKSRGFSVSLPVIQGIIQQLRGGAGSILNYFDPSFGKLDTLWHSSSGLEWLVNGSNATIALYNSTQSWLTGIEQQGFGQTLLAHSGIDAFLQPVANLTYSESRSDLTYETTGVGMVQRRSWRVDAQTAIIDGIPVEISEDMRVKADNLLFKSVGLETSMRQEERSASVGVTPTGDIVSVSASYDKSTHQSEQVQQQHLNVGGNLHIEAKRCDIQGSDIQARTVTGHIGTLAIETLQDTSHSESIHASASTAGQFSVGHDKSKSAISNSVAGIHTHEGLNHDDEHRLEIDRLENTGGAITTEGVNRLAANHVINHKVKDYERGSSIGFSGNAHDLVNACGEQSTQRPDGEAELPNHIHTVAVSSGSKNYKAERVATYHGVQGTQLDFGNVRGKMHTSSVDGLRVIQDKQQSITLDIPVVNPHSFFQPAPKPALQSNTPPLSISETQEAEVLQDNNTVLVSEQSASLTDDAEVAKDDNPEILVSSESMNTMVINSVEPVIDLNTPIITDDVLNTGASSSMDMTMKLDTSERVTPLSLPGIEETLFQVYEQAANQMANQGYVSEAVERDLKERVVDAMLLSLKTGSEEGFGAIVKQMGAEYQAPLLTMLNDPKQRCNIGVKAGTGYCNLLITFGFNVALTNGETTSEHLANAAKSSINDLVIGFGLRRAAGAAAGPIGWVWTGLSIVDTVCYDEDRVRREFENGVDIMKKAKELPSFWERATLQHLGAQQIERSATAKGVHTLISFPEQACNAVWDFFQSQESTEAKECEHTPTAQFN